MESTIALNNLSLTVNGNGNTISQAASCNNAIALFDITGGTVTFKNVTIDGVNGGAAIRTVDTDFTADNITVQNANHTKSQGLLRLLGKNTIMNSTFKNNVCQNVITLNYDANSSTEPQIVKNCLFDGNACSEIAVLYYVHGSGATIDGNKFIGNTVTAAGNGATVYMGFTENNVITNNVFEGNTVTSPKKRSAGAIMVGYETVITGNAFIDNKVISEKSTGNDVCASVYYTDIDLSGNYWGGSAPVENDNYCLEYTNHSVIINDYLTTYNK